VIKVLFNGYRGRMGQVVVPALAAADDLAVVALCDPRATEASHRLPSCEDLPVYTDLGEALDQSGADVMVDFTQPDAVVASLRLALPRGVHCVVGTSGLNPAVLTELYQLAPSGTTLFWAANFALGAVLMMRLAEQAAVWFQDVEILEFHHNGKKDAPSGTAAATARQLAAARLAAGVISQSPGAASELPGYAGARGACVDGIPVHAIRAAGFTASQEVILSSPGETLTIRHDNTDRAAYLPGILLAVRTVPRRSGLIIGLEALLDF